METVGAVVPPSPHSTAAPSFLLPILLLCWNNSSLCSISTLPFFQAPQAVSHSPISATLHRCLSSFQNKPKKAQVPFLDGATGCCSHTAPWLAHTSELSHSADQEFMLNSGFALVSFPWFPSQRYRAPAQAASVTLAGQTATSRYGRYSRHVALPSQRALWFCPFLLACPCVSWDTRQTKLSFSLAQLSLTISLLVLQNLLLPEAGFH